MARGFGATFGTGSTDVIDTSFSAHSSLRSFAMWTNVHGAGGSSGGRIFGKGSSTDVERLYYGASSDYRYQRARSVASGRWGFPRPAADTWHHIAVTYDDGSTANNPLAYVDGVSQTVTRLVAPSGSVTTNSDVYEIGNQGTAFNWDGMLAEFAIWDAILTAAEAAALGAGINPTRIRPGSLVYYVPLYGIANEPAIFRNAGQSTITGAVQQNHVRIAPPFTGRAFVSGGKISAGFNVKQLAALGVG